MAHALPLTKLAGLLVKTLSKPLSKRIKHEFSRYHITQRLLIGIGQTNHRITSRMTVWAAGYQVRKINDLEPETAMKQGAEFVGESIVFLVSGSVVVWEYNRSGESARKKEQMAREEARQQRDALKAKLVSLDKRLHALEEVVKSNSKFPLHFGKAYVEPSNVVPIDDGDETSSLPSLTTSSTLNAPAPVTGPTDDAPNKDDAIAEKGSEENKKLSLQKRLTKVEETKSIWEQFVWRPW